MNITRPGAVATSVAAVNLMAHLRSNLTHPVQARRTRHRRCHQGAPGVGPLPQGPRRPERQPVALPPPDHAAGLGPIGVDSEAELFKKTPDIDTFDRFRSASDTEVVVTIRGIGEMEPQNPASFVRLDAEPDEFGQRRAFAAIAPSASDMDVWKAMDTAADDLAMVLAGADEYEVLTAKGFVKVPAGKAPSEVAPFESRRDKLGTPITRRERCGWETTRRRR